MSEASREQDALAGAIGVIDNAIAARVRLSGGRRLNSAARSPVATTPAATRSSAPA